MNSERISEARCLLYANGSKLSPNEKMCIGRLFQECKIVAAFIAELLLGDAMQDEKDVNKKILAAICRNVRTSYNKDVWPTWPLIIADVMEGLKRTDAGEEALARVASMAEFEQFKVYRAVEAVLLGREQDSHMRQIESAYASQSRQPTPSPTPTKPASAAPVPTASSPPSSPLSGRIRRKTP